MNRERFEGLVAEAVESLPEEFRERLENVVIVVEDEPTRAQLKEAGIRRGHALLGLYEGIPQTGRSSYYGLVPPDKITIFQKPIEEKCAGDDEIKKEVRRVVRHEIAHHFGIGDRHLDQLERCKR
jgi:predicted Zn-dependent protease with MMP-like domain